MSGAAASGKYTDRGFNLMRPMARVRSIEFGKLLIRHAHAYILEFSTESRIDDDNENDAIHRHAILQFDGKDSVPCTTS